MVSETKGFCSNQKRLESVLLTFPNRINQDRLQLKRLIPIEHDLSIYSGKGLPYKYGGVLVGPVHNEPLKGTISIHIFGRGSSSFPVRGTNVDSYWWVIYNARQRSLGHFTKCHSVLPSLHNNVEILSQDWISVLYWGRGGGGEDKDHSEAQWSSVPRLLTSNVVPVCLWLTLKTYSKRNLNMRIM